MQRITLKVGDSIKQDQKVVVLEPLPSQALDPRSHAEAEKNVTAAEAAMNAAIEKDRAAIAESDYAAKRLERLNKLYKKGYVTKDQLEQAESDANKARATDLSAKAMVDVARSELERAKTTLQHFSINRKTGSHSTISVISPVSGSVFKIHHESEGVVNVGEPLIDVGDPENMEVRADILSADAVKISRGTPVIFKQWGGEGSLQGRVRVVEPAGFTKVSSLGVEEQRVHVIIDITSPFKTWHALGDGYRLDAYFIIWAGNNVLQVPTSALFRSKQGWAVFVAEHGKAKLRMVEVGQRNGLISEVVSGLKENEQVIVHPDDSIKQGVKIEIKT
jgi:HlyD family secretion protein